MFHHDTCDGVSVAAELRWFSCKWEPHILSEFHSPKLFQRVHQLGSLAALVSFTEKRQKNWMTFPQTFGASLEICTRLGWRGPHGTDDYVITILGESQFVSNWSLRRKRARNVRRRWFNSSVFEAFPNLMARQLHDQIDGFTTRNIAIWITIIIIVIRQHQHLKASPRATCCSCVICLTILASQNFVHVFSHHRNKLQSFTWSFLSTIGFFFSLYLQVFLWLLLWTLYPVLSPFF